MSSSTQDQAQGLMETAFHLDSVEPVADPTGGDNPWFRYTISQGPHRDNVITGTKSGSPHEVHLQLAEMVRRLNERFGKLEAKQKLSRR